MRNILLDVKMRKKAKLEINLQKCNYVQIVELGHESVSMIFSFSILADLKV